MSLIIFDVGAKCNKINERGAFSVSVKSFIKNVGCAGLSLPAARFIMAAIPQTFCSPFSAVPSLAQVMVNFGTQIAKSGFCVPGRLCLRKF